jgi:hypothetical protein
VPPDIRRASAHPVSVQETSERDAGAVKYSVFAHGDSPLSAKVRFNENIN